MLAVVLLALGLTAPGPAYAQGARELMGRGVEAYRNADFARALELFREALARPDVSRAEAVEIYGYIAQSHVALGNTQEATRALRQLIRLQPKFQFPAGTAPKIVELLEEVRRTTPSFSHRPERDVSVGPPVTVRARVARLPAGAQVVVYYRYSADGSFTAQRMSPAAGARGVFQAALPPPPAGVKVPGSRTGLEYYLAVEAAGGEALASVGQPTQPLRFVVAERAVPTPAPAEPTPLYKRWWPWAIVGAVVAGGVVAGVLATRDGGGFNPMGPTQEVTLRFNTP